MFLLSIDESLLHWKKLQDTTLEWGTEKKKKDKMGQFAKQTSTEISWKDIFKQMTQT